MQIFQGIKSVDEIEPLADSGAKEFYTGVVDKRTEAIRNHYPPEDNLESLEALAMAAKTAHNKNCKLFFAINHAFFVHDQIEAILNQIDQVVETGVDGLIVASAPLLAKLAERRLGVSLCLSTLQPLFNAPSVEFFKGFGIDRIVFPEQTGAYEVESVLKDDTLITEAFFHISHDCTNLEPFCLFHHRHGNYLTIEENLHGFGFCHDAPEVVSVAGEKSEEVKDIVERFYPWRKRYKINDYGNLYDYHRLGLDFLKMGNRPARLDFKLLVLRHAKALIDMLDGVQMSRAEFIRRAGEDFKIRMHKAGLPLEKERNRG